MTEFSDKETMYPGELRGYRAWQSDLTKDDLVPTGRLRAVNFSTIWNTTQVAVCKKLLLTHPDPAPKLDCVCGLYAYYDCYETFDQHVSIRRGNPVAPILGVVAASGKVILGTKGFRAQRMRILALWLPSASLHFPPIVQAFIFGKMVELSHPTQVYPFLYRHYYTQEYPQVRFYETVEKMWRDFPPDDIAGLLND